MLTTSFALACAERLRAAASTLFERSLSSSQLTDAAGSQAALRRDRFREAEDARALADRYRDIDPRFAQELYAAACRHEGLA